MEQAVCVTVDHMTCEAVSRDDVNVSFSLVWGGGRATDTWISRMNLNAFLKLIQSSQIELAVSFLQFGFVELIKVGQTDRIWS